MPSHTLVPRPTDEGLLDAYLDIAVTILRSEKRPLTARAILAAGYRNGLVPAHLHGKTQHKTLQARLSEDIVARRERSLFFRTAPGCFFLREFLADAALPEEFRRPVPTRRRFRELVRGPALAIDYDVLKGLAEENTAIRPQTIYDLIRADRYRYDDPRRGNTNSVFLRSFVCVLRRADVLTYRVGRYRDDRDSFVAKRSIGFSALVHVDARTLFNCSDFGIVESGVQATKIDLDVPEVADERVEASLSHFIWSREATYANDLLAVIAFRCPQWFEPTKRRLALNDISWLNFDCPVNNLQDFDPWSRSVLSVKYKANAGLNAAFKPYPAFPG